MKMFEFWLKVHLVSIGLGNNLAQSAAKPLPEPMITQFSLAYVTRP